MKLLERFNQLEQQFLVNPGDESLLNFIQNLNFIIKHDIYTKDQILEFKNRLLKFKVDLITIKRNILIKRLEAQKGYQNILQYIKISKMSNYGVRNNF